MKRSTRKSMLRPGLYEGKSLVYNLISDSETNLENALKMAKKNKKMKSMIPAIQKALEAIRGIE